MPSTATTTNASGSTELAKHTQLPNNIAAEKSVLAVCMLNSEATDEIVGALKPESFFRPAHRIIFESIADLVRRSIPVDPISLADTL